MREEALGEGLVQRLCFEPCWQRSWWEGAERGQGDQSGLRASPVAGVSRLDTSVVSSVSFGLSLLAFDHFDSTLTHMTGQRLGENLANCFFKAGTCCLIEGILHGAETNVQRLFPLLNTQKRYLHLQLSRTPVRQELLHQDGKQKIPHFVSLLASAQLIDNSSPKGLNKFMLLSQIMFSFIRDTLPVRFLVNSLYCVFVIFFFSVSLFLYL